MVRNGSPVTVSHEDDLTRSTPDPEPSPPSPRGEDYQPEPTDDGEPFPTTICKPVLSRATERMIDPEVEPNPSDQVREPVTVPTMREQAVDSVSAEWSSTPCTAAEGELETHLGLLDMEWDLIDWDAALETEEPPLLSPSCPLVLSSPPSSLNPLSSPEGASDPPVPTPRECHPVPAPCKCPTSHPLLPPAPLLSGSPPARPQPPYWYGASPVGLPFSSVAGAGVFLTSTSSLLGRRPRASTSAPSSLASTVTHRPTSSTGLSRPPAPPWSGIDLSSPLDSSPLAAPPRSVPPALLGSFLLSAPPRS